MKTLDIITVIASLAVVAIIGALSGRKTLQNRTAKDFMLANKEINKLQAGFSMAATDFGGSGLIGCIGYCYAVGMSGMWWNLAAAPAFFLVGIILARYFNRMDAATVPEYLGKKYGKTVRILSSVMHLLSIFAGLAAQFTVSSAVVHTCTGLSYRWALIITLFLVIALTSGGLRTVVNTDSILFVIIIFSVATSVPITLSAVGGFDNMVAAVPAEFMRIDQLGVWTPISWFLMCFFGYSTDQHYVQRMVAAKDEGTAVFGAIFTGVFYVIVSICLGLLGVAGSILHPNIAETNEIFPSMLLDYFPVGLTGLGIAAVLAAAISTGTSVLHAASTLFTNDIWLPLRGKGADDRKIFLVSRITVVLFALVAFGLSSLWNDIVAFAYGAGLFYGVSIFAPMVIGLFWKKRLRSSTVLVSILLSVFAALVWEYIPSLRLDFIAWLPSNVLALIVSVVSIMIGTAVSGSQEEP